MTYQEIFNRAYLGVLAQGGPSVKYSGTTPYCMYRSPEGKACAIGQLITDEAYIKNGDRLDGVDGYAYCITSRDLIEKSKDAAYLWAALSKSGVTKGHSKDRLAHLLDSLQRCHDSATSYSATNGLNFEDAFKANMAELARNWKLEIPKENV